MAVDFTKLKELREKSGVSFSACKKALEETDNDIKAAEKKLKEWGIKKADEKSEKTTGEGAIFSYTHHNKKIATLVELLCETDFVAKNEEFQQLGGELAMQAASTTSNSVEDFVDQDYIREPAKKISQLIKEAIAKFGENIRVTRIMRWNLGTE